MGCCFSNPHPPPPPHSPSPPAPAPPPPFKLSSTYTSTSTSKSSHPPTHPPPPPYPPLPLPPPPPPPPPPPFKPSSTSTSKSSHPPPFSFPSPPPPPPPPQLPPVRPQYPPPPTLPAEPTSERLIMEEIISNFQEFDIESQADVFIEDMKEFLKAVQKKTKDSPSTNSSHSDKLSNWDSIIRSGGRFLEYLDSQIIEKMKYGTEDSLSESGKATENVGNIVKQIDNVQGPVAGLSVVGFLVSECAKASENRTECLDLLREMITLFSNAIDLNKQIADETDIFEKTFKYIIEGSICCASQLRSGNIFRFLKPSVNSAKLFALRSEIILLNDVERVKSKTTPKATLRSQPTDAVGIDDQLKTVNELLNMEKTHDCSSIAVVIWGFNGIGKTTLANAVVSTIDRNRYNFAKIELGSVPSENNYKKIQQQILKDAFPSYQEGRKVGLRDDADGRDHIAAAFKSGANKPVFLFIDNVLRIKDLEKILPEDLRDLPEQSRIVVTSRILRVTDVLEERGLQRKVHRVKTLSEHHALAILCNDPATRHGIEDYLTKIVNICHGIPLVLKMVAADLFKQEYRAECCRRILEALQTGGKIKEEELSTRLFHFVYNRLKDSTREAFMDICCFFNKELRRSVEYVLDSAEVTFLVNSALITTAMNEEEEEILSVHDIIRSIARSMPESGRIVDKNSWLAVEKDKAKLERIRGLCVQSGDCVLEKEHLHSMRNTLSVLMWNGSINVGATDAVKLPELKYIRTKRDICGLKIEALDKLAVLICKKLPIQPTDQLLKLPECLRWFQADELQDLSNALPNSSLEELYLTFSEQRELSDEEQDYSKSTFDEFLMGLSKLKHLQVNYQPLCELPERVCSLRQLRTLRIFYCYKLESLPDSFGQLKALRELDLSGCVSLKELPSTFGQLTTLRKLNLTWCHSLKELPPTFHNLRSLEHLCLIKCHNLQSDICQKDDNIRIVKKTDHYCINICQQNRKLKIIYS